ncbi:MAG: PIN domain-containing protein [Phycisphaerae bacterium]
MKVVVDTGALVGLVNSRDQWHSPAKAIRNRLLQRKADLFVPRIVRVELYAHATRLQSKSDSANERKRFIQSIEALELPIIEHELSDFVAAERWWTQYADWPLDLPDVLIVETARRIHAERIWAFDKNLTKFVAQTRGSLRTIGAPNGGVEP